VRGEVRYVDLGSHNFNIAGTRHKARYDSTNITLGVSYKF
jgi:opacity protein-like surface antigen